MKKVLCTMMMLAVTMAVMAVPAKKGLTKTIQLANGTEMKATLVGDEYGHFWKTQDGKAYQKIAGTYQEVNAKAVAEKAKARRNKVNAQRVKRLKAAKRVGEVGSYQGTKKAIMILVNFSDVKYQASHDNALFRRLPIRRTSMTVSSRALCATISRLRAVVSSRWTSTWWVL